MKRLSTLIAVVIVVAAANRAIAGGAPVANGNAALNRQLATMASTSAPIPAALPAIQQFSTPTPIDKRANPSWFSSPAFLAIAAHFTTAERLLHYRHGGVDGNFWGMLSSDHRIKIQFSTRF